MSKSSTQVKFTIDSKTVNTFKARCAAEGVSMTSVIYQFMQSSRPINSMRVKTDTRLQRKKAVLKIIGLLDKIMEMEALYRDAIPEQFELRYETADLACEQLAQAISCLEDAF